LVIALASTENKSVTRKQKENFTDSDQSAD